METSNVAGVVEGARGARGGEGLVMVGKGMIWRLRRTSP